MTDQEAEEKRNFQLQPGRLVIKCCKVFSLNSTSADRNYSNLRFRFSYKNKAGESLVSISKSIPEICDGSDLEDVSVKFDIIDPNVYPLENYTFINVELLHECKLVQSILARTIVPITSLIPIFFNDVTVITDRFTLSSVDDLVTNSAVELEFSYFLTNEGILSLFLNKDLLTPLALTAEDTTIQILMGQISKHVRSSDVNRSSGAQIHVEFTKSNWFQNITINIMHQEELIAWSTKSLVEYINDDKKYDISLQFYTPDILSSQSGPKVALGISPLKVRFLKSGMLHVKDMNTSSLHNIGNANMSTIQIVFTCEGMASTLRNEVNDPNHQITSGDNLFSMNIVDHDEMNLECFLLDALGNKISMLGTGKLSLLPVYSRGTYNASIPIKDHEEGTVVDRGSIFLSLKFDGHGQNFPKLHIEESIVTKSPEQALTANRPSIDYKDNVTSEKGCEVFSDEDIKSTFELCDLDRNGYIGTAELRHVLICMGEIVSEEEIDAMIQMLDKNGDGQIDLNQFSIMAKSESFGMDESNKPALDNQKFNDNVKIDSYRNKLQVLSNFVAKFNLDKDKLNGLCQSLFQRRNLVYSKVADNELDQYSRSCSIWRIDHPTLRNLLQLDDISDVRNVFEMLNPDPSKHEIDARDFILGTMSFIHAYSVYERTKIMFDLYDERRTGYIQASDLVSMLASSHLKPRDAVIRKSETVLKVVDSKGMGKLTHKDLMNAATKFPNLLFFRVPKAIMMEQ
jgi:Ca2+-binding EF-hand superfamily protein